MTRVRAGGDRGRRRRTDSCGPRGACGRQAWGYEPPRGATVSPTEARQGAARPARARRTTGGAGARQPHHFPRRRNVDAGRALSRTAGHSVGGRRRVPAAPHVLPRGRCCAPAGRPRGGSTNSAVLTSRALRRDGQRRPLRRARRVQGDQLVVRRRPPGSRPPAGRPARRPGRASRSPGRQASGPALPDDQVRGQVRGSSSPRTGSGASGPSSSSRSERAARSGRPRRERRSSPDFTDGARTGAFRHRFAALTCT